jgi:hypothetical protein
MGERVKQPKLYAPVKIKFWSLRNGVGSGLGVLFDIDTEVTRTCRRVLYLGGWKWQLVRYYQDRDWDWCLEQDKEVLDNYREEVEWQYD